MSEEWIELTTDEGGVYYYNEAQQLTQWEPPDGFVSAAAAAPAEPAAAAVEVAANGAAEGGGGGILGAATRAAAEGKEDEARSKSKGRAARAASQKLQVWEVKYTASVGKAKHGERYFTHKVTGETQWDTPDDYVSDDEDEEAEEIDSDLEIDPEAALEDSFQKVCKVFGTADERGKGGETGRMGGRGERREGIGESERKGARGVVVYL